MKKFIASSVLIMIFMSSTGCSIHHALSSPPPLPVENITAGKHRNEIVSILGLPKLTETKTNGRTEIYEFVDGYSAGSKTRVVLYIAGDFFTLGIAEIIFWPIELAAGPGIEGRAIVDYGMDDIAKNVLLTKKDGSQYLQAAKQDPVVQPAQPPQQ